MSRPPGRCCGPLPASRFPNCNAAPLFFRCRRGRTRDLGRPEVEGAPVVAPPQTWRASAFHCRFSSFPSIFVSAMYFRTQRHILPLQLFLATGGIAIRGGQGWVALSSESRVPSACIHAWMCRMRCATGCLFLPHILASHSPCLMTRDEVRSSLLSSGLVQSTKRPAPKEQKRGNFFHPWR